LSIEKWGKMYPFPKNFQEIGPNSPRQIKKAAVGKDFGCSRKKNQWRCSDIGADFEGSLTRFLILLLFPFKKTTLILT